MSRVKIVVLGDQGVGKSTLVKSFTRAVRPQRRVGADVYSLNIPIGRGRSQSLEIVDTCKSFLGKVFKVDVRQQIKYGDAFVIVYSVDDPKSYCDAMDLCLLVYRKKGSMDVPLVVVGNKADLPYKVSLHRLTQLGDLPHIHATSRSGMSVSYVFDMLLHIVHMEERKEEQEREKMRRFNRRRFHSQPDSRGSEEYRDVRKSREKRRGCQKISRGSHSSQDGMGSMENQDVRGSRNDSSGSRSQWDSMGSEQDLVVRGSRSRKNSMIFAQDRDVKDFPKDINVSRKDGRESRKDMKGHERRQRSISEGCEMIRSRIREEIPEQ